jgi:hypothetical protein
MVCIRHRILKAMSRREGVDAMHPLGDSKCLILCLRVRGFVKAIRTVWNTRVFLMETRVVANGPCSG